MALTLRERLQLLAVTQVEHLELCQLPEAFGQQTGEQSVRVSKYGMCNVAVMQVSLGATYSQEETADSCSSTS